MKMYIFEFQLRSKNIRKDQRPIWLEATTWCHSTIHLQMQNMLEKLCVQISREREKNKAEKDDFSFGCWMFTKSHDVTDSWCVKIRCEKKNGLGFVR